MLTKQHRFSGSRSIQRLYKHGQAYRTKVLGLRYQREAGQPFRLAVIVSRKVHKSAVVRNRIRRRIYEVVRTRYAQQLGDKQVSITVFDASLATVSAETIHRELDQLLSKAQAGGRPKTNRGIVESKGE